MREWYYLSVENLREPKPKWYNSSLDNLREPKPKWYNSSLDNLRSEVRNNSILLLLDKFGKLGRKTKQRFRRLKQNPFCDRCQCDLTLANSCLRKSKKKRGRLLLCLTCSRGRPDYKKNRLARIRRKLWEKDPCCHYCRCKLIFAESTLDHVHPKSKGGSGKQENLVLSCLLCNLIKGDYELDVFLEKAS